MGKRGAAIAAVTIFLVLATTQASHALWSAAASMTSTVKSGGVGISQTGFDQVPFQFSATALTNSDLITITNTGTVPATYTAILNAPASTLASAIKVESWAAGANCTATQGTVTSRTWTSGTTLSGTLAAGAAARHCVRTSLTATQVAANNGATVTAQLALSAAAGTSAWTTGTTVVTATQSVKDTVSPSRPGAPTVMKMTGYSTTLSWAASTDAVGVTRYDVVRDGVVIASTAERTYTDTALSPGTAYTYTIDAYDAAGNRGSGSKNRKVTTLPINSELWYKIVNPNSGRCLDASGVSQTSGTALINYTCSGAANQTWKFTPTGDGNYQMVARYQPAFSWEIDAASKARVATYAGLTNQQWSMSTSGSSYVFTNVASSLCLEVPGASTANAIQLQQNTCTGGIAQTFAITAVP